MAADQPEDVIARAIQEVIDGAPRTAAGFRLAGEVLNDPEIRRAIEEGRLLEAQRMILEATDQ